MDKSASAELFTDARAMLASAVVVPHTDADGLAAGAIALRATGRSASEAMLLPRGETPFRRSFAVAPALLDWGVRSVAGPALFVDHHAPETAPDPGQVVISGYGERPEVTTSVLMRRLAPEQPGWLAAVGAVGDLGAAGLRLPECGGAPSRATRELTALVNAPRRLPDGPVDVALALLVQSDSPEAALWDRRAETLARCKDEWQRAFRSAVRTAPLVRDGAALIRFTSPYQVHPLVATAWQRRLAPRLVVAANDGYLADRVNFAVRGGHGDLRRVLLDALPEADGEYAHGHDRATGGSLAPADFERMLAGLGLDR